MSEARQAELFVLAGTNGADKSSVAGAQIERTMRFPHFNPDAVARRMIEIEPGLTIADANSAAWNRMLSLLDRAVDRGERFAFETTLGGKTIAQRLIDAARSGAAVRIWFTGLASPEMHIDRVARRVASGGHDIAEADIRRRYPSSISNLIELLPWCAEVVVYDNSTENDFSTLAAPDALLVLHTVGAQTLELCARNLVPEWAKPIVARALEM